ncbi:Cache 3/Cache 2 fusion domain-containing protein [Desulfobulbus elongatus]|uniref:Cache 3/Cache 2 fusion domain-containing protein n=1 Tax=Desulfobulbus elongatus TaxID=53332 RepID=UPI000686C3EE|nr:Cache 3/Cache 2 fusion domain-containing protein [Desulfobulbus elongatus]
MHPFRQIRLSTKIALLSAGCVLLTAMTLVLLSVWQSGQYNLLAQGEVDALIEADLDHITQGMYHLVRTADETAQLQVNNNLRVAERLLTDAGEVRLGEETVAWQTVNRATGETGQPVLPAFFVGNRWIGKNRDPAVETPVVDEVGRLTGASATLFQRMNERGDMLRVATTVRTPTGARAIGTCIPAVDADGGANPVIAAVLAGRTFHGRSHVVNDWYLTAYAPVRDNAGRLVGMLYVGLRQEAVAARVRQAIVQSTIGKTGYVYVLGGGGEERGRYVISYRGERDGEQVLNVRDSDGRLVIREILDRATRLQPGEMATVRYRWQNQGEPAPRPKVARLAYYAPWDWVIGTSVYEDELQNYSNVLREGRARMIRIMLVAGCGITVLVGLACLVVTWSLIRPVRQMTEVAHKIIAGDFTQLIPVKSGDEIGILARTFNLMTGELERYTEGLRQSEEKYRGIFENALEGFYQSSLEGRFLTANPALASLLGYASPEEFIAAVIDSRHQLYADPDDRNRLLAALSEHRQALVEVQVLRKDGRRIWVSISAHLRRGAAGQPEMIEGFISDITTRKQAEDALAESRNYLDEIINSFGDPMFVKDREHRWMLVNTAMCALMGRPRDEVLGRTDYDFFPAAEVEVFWAKDASVLASGRENINEEWLTDGRGVRHVVLTKKTLYTDKNGDPYIVGIIRDITEQRRAEEERVRLEAMLNQAQKMEAIGTLAGGIAHDFNNILQPMLGYSELLRLRLPPDSAQQKYVERLHAAGLRAKELIGQILAFSRQAEHKVVPVRMQAVLKEVYKLCRATIPANIQIKMDIDTQCPSVLLDPSQVHQVAMNLIINAYHAVEASGGRIDIRLREVALTRPAAADSPLPPGRYVLFSVADTGCGIDPAILDRVFDPYFTTKEQGKGTGLGLAVVHGIVKEHGGDIAVASEVGRGTTFRVYLPLLDEAVEQAAPTAPEVYSGGDERILVVDDEAMIVEIMTVLLEGLGYRVTSRENGRAALALFTADPTAFDLVLTDLMMPHMTGEQLARAILAIRPDMPIIVCSGFSERLGRERARDVGVRALLTKPLGIAELSCEVRAALDARPPG